MNVDDTRGRYLVKFLGTFFTRYYKQKKFLLSLTESYEEIATQYEKEVDELRLHTNYLLSPLEKIERYYKIDLSSKTFLFTAGRTTSIPEQSVCGVEGVKIPENLISVKYLLDKIISPSFILKEGEDFLVHKGAIEILKDVSPYNELWAKEVSFSDDTFLNNAGFIFFSESLPRVNILTFLLLKLFRYGLYKKPLVSFFTVFFNHLFIQEENETVTDITPFVVYTDKNTYELPTGLSCVVEVGKTYEMFSPITDAVEVKDAKNENFYVKNGEVFTRKLEIVPNQVGHGVVGVNKIGVPYGIHDFYDKGLADEPVYQVYVKATKTEYTTSYLDLIQKILPVWLSLSIILEYEPEQEIYSEIDEEVFLVSDAAGPFVDTYKNIFDATRNLIVLGDKDKNGETIKVGSVVIGQIKEVERVFVHEHRTD